MNAERLSWSQNNSTGAFASPLKLPFTGYRQTGSGSILNTLVNGRYWCSPVDGINSRNLYFSSSAAFMNTNSRAFGFSVRCIKN